MLLVNVFVPDGVVVGVVVVWTVEVTKSLELQLFFKSSW